MPSSCYRHGHRRLQRLHDHILLRSPQGALLLARLPLLQPVLAAGADAPANDRPRGPQRSIPYAGYMALVAIVLMMRNSVPFQG